MKLFKYHCVRCGHIWTPRKESKPVVCPNRACHSPYWQIPKQEKKEVREDDN